MRHEPNPLYTAKPYLTGLQEIDDEHEDLLIVVTDFARAVESGAERSLVEKMISVAYNYADYHFHHEEGIMRSLSYPFRIDHEECHRRFLGAINKFQHEYSRGNDISEEIPYFLQAWVRDHIFGPDKELALYLKYPS